VTRGVVSLFLAGLVVQIAALGLSGTRDVYQFKTWAMTSLDRPFFETYSYDLPVAPTGVSPIPDYPPLSVAMLAVSARVARWIQPEVTRDARQLTVLVKAPLLVLQVVVCWLIWRLTKSAPAVLMFWLNPAFVLDGPVLGYLDLPCWLAGTGAVIVALDGRAAWTGALLAVSILVKPQGLFFLVPVAAALGGSRALLLRAALVTGAIVALAFLPFVLATPHGVWTSMISNFSEDLLSGDALNLWWLVSAAGFVWTYGGAALDHAFGSPNVSTFAARAGLDPRPWATLAIALVAGWAMWRVRSRATQVRVAALGAFVIHVYFVLAVAVHENHLVHALPLLGLAAIGDRKYAPLYVAVSAVVTFNLLALQGLGVDFWTAPRTGGFLPLTVAGAIASVALLVRHARAFGEVTRATMGRAPR
jgi:hypothetical protein